MAYGDGTIIEKAKGVYEVQVSFGRNPITGKYDRATETVHGTKRDAIKARDRLKRERDNGIKVDGSKIAFRVLASSWLDKLENQGGLAESTLDDHKQTVSVLNRYIGDEKIKEISPAVVDTLLTQIRKDRGISNSRLKKYHVTLNQIFKRAESLELIARNPCSKVAPPACEKSNRKSLDRTQATRLLQLINNAEDCEYEVFSKREQRRAKREKSDEDRERIRGLSKLSNIMVVRLALATGMRRGEIFALTWENVDLKNGIIHVAHSLSTRSRIPKEPKTKSGIRNIAIDESTISHLEKWQSFQFSALGDLGILEDAFCKKPVCCSNIGDYINSAGFSRWWVNWRNDNGFENLKLHELRHTQATQLLASGIDVKTVQTRLGHSSATLTLDWYAHAVPENDRKAANLIGSIFSKKPLTVISGSEKKEAV